MHVDVQKWHREGYGRMCRSHAKRMLDRARDGQTHKYDKYDRYD